MTAFPRLSVVVPTRNRRELLISKTLPAIFGQNIPADQYEVIIVDDGSSDGTAQALRELLYPRVLRIIELSTQGASAARNRGIKAARGDLILFLDDDIICSPNLFRHHLAAHAQADPVVVYGSISLAPGLPSSLLKRAIEVWYEDYYRRLGAQGGLCWPQDIFLISNSSLPRATLLACGGFDESLPAKEDYELGLRLWKMGVPFKYLPEAAAVEHYCKPAYAFLRDDGAGFGKTEVRLSRKHPEYRPHSSLAALGKAAGWRRLWQRTYLRLPLVPIGLLRLPIWICDKLSRFPALRRIGLHLLGVGRGMSEFRSAAREAGSWRALQSEFGMRLPVLLYHNVGPERPGITPGLTVSARQFERHIAWLARRGFTGIRPSDWVRWRREGRGLPAKPLLLTFDDGYEDLVEHAFPVLRRYGFGAAVYIVTRQLGGTNAWDTASGPPTHRLMTADEIRYWATQGIEFGAHGRTHADLTTLSAPALEEEVVGSGKDLESLLGAPVVSFAYPYGAHNQAVDDCARRAYPLAFIADDDHEGLNHLLTDPHLMLRTMVQPNDSLVALECRARWGHNPFLNLRARLGLRTRLKRAARRTVAGRKQ
jgi:glycosyltransferase involved in cell wall biosynthesis/peptidoglycan/xylan/chitin deacetylase (PgdA/CDA1 family)